MAAPCYIAWNADTSALTAPMAGVALASGTKTMLQIKSGSSKIRVIEWGYILTTTPAAPVQFELIETGTVFATVTTIGSGIRAYNDVTGAASLAVAGTAATGFTASAEGTITSSRLLAQKIDSATHFAQQFPLGREPEVNAGSALRIRATGTATILCYIAWEE